jgi:hypothetical protein
MQPIKKDTLVTYKGGGWDGCFWEWNFFIYDQEGKFVDIGSSGRKAITEEKDARELLEGKHEQELGKDYFITDLNDKTSIEEFVRETNDGNVLGVIAKVNEHYGEDKMTFKCPECEQMSTEGNTTGERGNGGVGIERYGLLCSDCYCGHTCGYCGAYHEDMQELNVDNDNDHCTYCTKKEKKEENDNEDNN